MVWSATLGRVISGFEVVDRPSIKAIVHKSCGELKFLNIKSFGNKTMPSQHLFPYFININ